MTRDEQLGAGHVEVVIGLADAGGRLIEVHHVAGAYLAGHLRQEDLLAIGTLSVDVAEESGGIMDFEQICHRLGRPLEGEILAGQELEPEGTYPWTIRSTRSGFWREGGLVLMPARAADIVDSVLRDDYRRCGNLEDIADLLVQDLCIGEIGAIAGTYLVLLWPSSSIPTSSATSRTNRKHHAPVTRVLGVLFPSAVAQVTARPGYSDQSAGREK